MLCSQFWIPFPFSRLISHDKCGDEHHFGIFDLSRPLVAHDTMHLLLLVFGFMSIFIYHTRYEVPNYHRKFQKKKIYLYFHIFTGLTAAARYRLHETLQGHSNILPDAVDVLCSFIWGWTSLELVKTLRRGDPRTTRPPYQAGTLLRPVLSLMSYLLGMPSLHRLSISALDSFLYARLAIFFFSSTPYIRSYGPRTIYAISIPLAAVISIHGSRVPGASLVFIFATSYITKLNEWVADQSRYLRQSGHSSNISNHWKKLITTLVSLGFVELEELREATKVKELEVPVRDEYVAMPPMKIDE